MRACRRLVGQFGNNSLSHPGSLRVKWSITKVIWSGIKLSDVSHRMISAHIIEILFVLYDNYDVWCALCR